MTNIEPRKDTDLSLTPAESGVEKLYRRLLALFSICAFAATGIVSVGDILWSPAFSFTKPNLHPALCTALMGLGFVFGSSLLSARPQNRGNSQPRAYLPQLFLLLMGVLELCFAGLIAHSNLKVLGY